MSATQLPRSYPTDNKFPVAQQKNPNINPRQIPYKPFQPQPQYNIDVIRQFYGIVLNGDINEINQFILNNSININLPNEDSNSLLNVIIDNDIIDMTEKQKNELVEFFIQKGVAVNMPNKFNITPLHIAAKRHYSMIIQTLINAGANLNAIDNYGKSPLHYATSNTSDKTTQELVPKENFTAKISDTNTHELIITILNLLKKSDIAVYRKHLSNSIKNIKFYFPETFIQYKKKIAQETLSFAQQNKQEQQNIESKISNVSDSIYKQIELKMKNTFQNYALVENYPGPIWNNVLIDNSPNIKLPQIENKYLNQFNKIINTLQNINIYKFDDLNNYSTNINYHLNKIFEINNFLFINSTSKEVMPNKTGFQRNVITYPDVFISPNIINQYVIYKNNNLHDFYDLTINGKIPTNYGYLFDPRIYGPIQINRMTRVNAKKYGILDVELDLSFDGDTILGYYIEDNIAYDNFSRFVFKNYNTLSGNLIVDDKYVNFDALIISKNYDYKTKKYTYQIPQQNKNNDAPTRPILLQNSINIGSQNILPSNLYPLFDINLLNHRRSNHTGLPHYFTVRLHIANIQIQRNISVINRNIEILVNLFKDKLINWHLIFRFLIPNIVTSIFNIYQNMLMASEDEEYIMRQINLLYKEAKLKFDTHIDHPYAYGLDYIVESIEIIKNNVTKTYQKYKSYYDKLAELFKLFNNIAELMTNDTEMKYNKTYFDNSNNIIVENTFDIKPLLLSKPPNTLLDYVNKYLNVPVENIKKDIIIKYIPLINLNNYATYYSQALTNTNNYLYSSLAIYPTDFIQNLRLINATPFGNINEPPISGYLISPSIEFDQITSDNYISPIGFDGYLPINVPNITYNINNQYQYLLENNIFPNEENGGKGIINVDNNIKIIDKQIIPSQFNNKIDLPPNNIDYFKLTPTKNNFIPNNYMLLPSANTYGSYGLINQTYNDTKESFAIRSMGENIDEHLGMIKFIIIQSVISYFDTNNSEIQNAKSNFLENINKLGLQNGNMILNKTVAKLSNDILDTYVKLILQQQINGYVIDTMLKTNSIITKRYNLLSIPSLMINNDSQKSLDLKSLNQNIISNFYNQIKYDPNKYSVINYTIPLVSSAAPSFYEYIFSSDLNTLSPVKLIKSIKTASIIQPMLRNNQTINTTDGNGNTPVFYSIENFDFDSINILKNNGAFVKNIKNNKNIDSVDFVKNMYGIYSNIISSSTIKGILNKIANSASDMLTKQLSSNPEISNNVIIYLNQIFHQLTIMVNNLVYYKSLSYDFRYDLINILGNIGVNTDPRYPIIFTNVQNSYGTVFQDIESNLNNQIENNNKLGEKLEIQKNALNKETNPLLRKVISDEITQINQKLSNIPDLLPNYINIATNKNQTNLKINSRNLIEFSKKTEINTLNPYNFYESLYKFLSNDQKDIESNDFILYNEMWKGLINDEKLLNHISNIQLVSFKLDITKLNDLYEKLIIPMFTSMLTKPYIHDENVNEIMYNTNLYIIHIVRYVICANLYYAIVRILTKNISNDTKDLKQTISSVNTIVNKNLYDYIILKMPELLVGSVLKFENLTIDQIFDDLNKRIIESYKGFDLSSLFKIYKTTILYTIPLMRRFIDNYATYMINLGRIIITYNNITKNN